MAAHAYWDSWVTTEVGVIRQMPYLGQSSIVVGARDFVITGHKSEITSWLLDHGNIPVKCDSGYGTSVYLILRGVAPTVMEEVAKAYAGNFAGMSGIGTGIATGVGHVAELAGGGSDAMGAVIGALTNPSALSADAIGDKLPDMAEGIDNLQGKNKPSKFAKAIDRVFGKSVVLRLSAAQGTFSDKGHAKGSIGTMQSGFSCMLIAGMFRQLKW